MRQLQDHPLLHPEGGPDGAEYLRLARQVIGGNLTLGPGLYYVSPLYLYFLAAAFGITGSFDGVRVIQLLLGTSAVWFVFKTAEQCFGRRAAWIAAVLMALTGPLTFYELLILQASLDTFLTAGALYFLTTGIFRLKAEATGEGFVASGFGWKILLSGVFLGLQILNRPNIVIAVAGMTVIMLVARRWRVALLFAAGVVLAMAPVVARNALVSHQFALASSHGGLNFYIGNNPSATGQYESVEGVRANIAGQAEDTRKVAEKAAGRPLTDGEVSSYFARQALDWIRGNQAAAARLFVRKLALVFNARHQWLDFSYPYYAYDTGSSLRWLFVGPWLLVPLGLVGAVARATVQRYEDEGRSAPLLTAFITLYAISVATFFVAERYRLPLLVALCISSGGGIEFLMRSRSSSSRLAVASALVIATALLTAYPFAVEDGRYEERLRLSKVLTNRGEYGAAARELEQALALKPGDPVTEFNLGIAQVSSGRASDGIVHMRQAVDAGVKIDGARYALVNAMLMTGDRDGAVTLLRTYFPAESDNADSCFQVGILALNAGAPRVAERYLVRALELRPGWPEAQQALAQLR